MFHVGDHVVSKYYGRGVVDFIADPRANFQYPVRVRWEKCKNYFLYGYFTMNGRHSSWKPDPEYDIVLVDEEDSMKFHVGDRVFAPFHKYGTIVEIDDTDASYPITVEWDESRYKIGIDLSTFTEDGYLFFGNKTLNTKITKVEGEEEVGQIAGVVEHNIEKAKMQDSKSMVEDKKFMETRRKNDEEHAKFHVGDLVYSKFSGVGKITKIGANKNLEYPIQVKWCEQKSTSTFDYDFFTLGGNFYSDRVDASRDIVHAEDVDFEGKDEGTVERMEDALDKKVDDAINPSHYKVEGLPEAIDIINHLMHREQYEGFLWGNILKYAYRYGRKGDKAETAGKIAWYAEQLKDLAEEADRK